MKKLSTTIATLLISMNLQAGLIVDVNGQNYDIETFNGLFSNNLSTLQSQVWWGDSSLAADFSNAVGRRLGTTNISGMYGPAFAFSWYNGVGADYVTVRAYDYPKGATQINAGGTTWQFATATLVPPVVEASEPGTLGLLAFSLVGLFYSRRSKVTHASSS